MRVASLDGDSGCGGRSADTREGASCTTAHESHKSDTRQDLPFCRRLNEGERHGALSTVRGFAGMLWFMMMFIRPCTMGAGGGAGASKARTEPGSGARAPVEVFCTRHSDARVVTATWMARTCWTSTKRMPRIKTPSTRSLGSRDELLQRKTCVRPCTQAMPFQAAGSVGNLHARSATYRTTELFPSRDFGKRVLIPRSLFHHMKALRRVCAHAQT